MQSVPSLQTPLRPSPTSLSATEPSQEVLWPQTCAWPVAPPTAPVAPETVFPTPCVAPPTVWYGCQPQSLYRCVIAGLGPCQHLHQRRRLSDICQYWKRILDSCTANLSSLRCLPSLQLSAIVSVPWRTPYGIRPPRDTFEPFQRCHLRDC